VTLIPAADPELASSVSLYVVDSSEVQRIAFHYVPASDTVQLTVGAEISIEPTLWAPSGVRVIGWPEAITVSDTLVTAIVQQPPAAFPRLLHFRAMKPGSSRLTAGFRQVAKTLTFVVSP
jgi:hypothetical protein